MLIINRYIILEIIKPMVVMFAVLVILFAAYSTMHYLEDAVYGLMPVSTVMKLILLKITISLEVLLPITLYLSVIVGLGRLYKDGEMTALFASGLGLGRVLTVVFTLSLLVSLLVASLSLWARPKAYERSFWLKAKAKAEFDFTRLKAGRFYEIGEGNQIIFINKIDPQGKRAEGVFIQKESKDEGGMLEVVYAKEARHHLDPSTGRQVILFLDGCAYEFPHTGKEGWSAVEFGQFTRSLWPKEITPIEYKIKAASSIHLGRSQAPSDIAELQWRLSAPLSTILLALLGVPLSRTVPHEGKYPKMATAMFIFAIYYGMGSVAKILVEQGVVPPLPGIWWVQGLLTGLLLALLHHPSQQFWPSRKRRN
ncbi:MAG: LPS export ABC transporter permease LptF [Deltaproteobacteria bacterium]|nr:LPS export ABC transporter permease LptF [Deltaproteobacteria bacterium]